MGIGFVLRLKRAISWRLRDRLEPLARLWDKHSGRFRRHDAVYGKKYFEFVDREAIASSVGIARSLVSMFHPRTVLDVGCGTGAMLSALQLEGVERGFGLEYAEAALALCHVRDLDVQKFDLESADIPKFSRRIDLVISMEVAEHLPSGVASSYVRLLASPKVPVVLTAAPPGQGGTDHVNEQPKEYWIDLFSRHSMRFDPDSTLALQGAWEASGVTWWYHRNVMVFRPDLSVSGEGV